MKSATSNPFYKKRFFLDIKGCPPGVEKNLVNDLKCLGAKEAFHCKDASFVVSNKAPLQSKPWTPVTPKTVNSPGHSPQLLSDNSMDLGSPEYMNSPVMDRRAVPLCQSRGQVLLQKSQQTVKKHGTTDTLAVCKQYGIKVYPIDKVLSYVKKIKNLYGAKKVNTNQEKPISKIVNRFSSSNNDVQKIRAPFVKIEDVNRRYRTRHRVFSSWADIIDPALSQSVKELQKNFTITGSIEHQTLFRPILKDLSVNNLHKGAQNSPFLMPLTPSCTKSFTKQSNINAQASPAVSVMSVDNTKKPGASHCEDKKKKCKRKKKKQYCEICGVYYSNLGEHIENKSHANFMGNACNYTDLEKLIAEIPKFTDIMKLNLPSCKSTDFESGFVSSSSYCSYLGDTSFVVQQASVLPQNIKNVPNLFSSDSAEFETELYDLDESFISATCSTVSTGFPFLEDKWDQDISPEFSIGKFKSCLSNGNQGQSNNSILLENSEATSASIVHDINTSQVTNKDAEFENSLILRETESKSADSPNEVSILKTPDVRIPLLSVFNEATDVSEVCPPNDKEGIVIETKSSKQTDLKELLVSMSESFENSMFANQQHVKSKKRKRGKDLETYMLKKFLRDELPFHISDALPNISNPLQIDSNALSNTSDALPHISDEVSADSGLCSAMMCERSLSQPPESDQPELQMSAPSNCADSNQAMDLSLLDSSRYTPNFHLDVLIPISVPDVNNSSSSLSPPILDLCKQDIPLLKTSTDSADPLYNSPPVLCAESPNNPTEKNTPFISAVNSQQTPQKPLLLPLVSSSELPNILTDKLAQFSPITSSNQINAPQETHSLALIEATESDSNVPDADCRNSLVSETFSNDTLPASLTKDPNSLKWCESIKVSTTLGDSAFKCMQIIGPGAKENDDTSDAFLETNETSHQLEKNDKCLNEGSFRLEKLLLYRNSFLYCFNKSSQWVCTPESIFERLLSISSQSYSSYCIEKVGEIYISKYQLQLSGSVILRLDLVKDFKVSQNNGICQAFVIMNASDENISFKFIKRKLKDLSFSYPTSVAKYLRKVSEWLDQKFQQWQKLSDANSLAPLPVGKSIDGVSCLNLSYRTDCRLCCMTDSFTPCNNPSCLKKGGVVLKLVDLIRLNLISRKGDYIDNLCKTENVRCSEAAVDLSVSSNQSNPPKKVSSPDECENDATCSANMESNNAELSVDIPSSSMLEPSSCCSTGTLCRDDCQESMVEGFESEGEYIIVDESSCSDEMDWTEIEQEVHRKCLNPYSEEF